MRSKESSVTSPQSHGQEHWPRSPPPPQTAAGGVAKVAFSPDGQRLAGVSGDGTLKFWDAAPLPEKP